MRILIETARAVSLRHLFEQGGHGVPVSMEQIIWQIRMPRIILGFLTGSGLALCGCMMQAVVQNPMTDPYTLGVSAGTTLSTMGSLFLGVGVVSGFRAFLGAGLAYLLMLVLASADGKTTSAKLILAGITVNALLTVFSNFIITVAGNSDGVLSIKFWTTGALTRAGWENIGLIAVVVALAALYLMSQAKTLGGLLLDEEAAVTIGVDTFRCRLACLLVLSLLTGVLVSACGTIGFVRLIIPHLTWALVSTAHRRLLSVTAFSGDLSILWVDALARSLLPSVELPVGIFTALTGTPFFVYMIVRKRHGFGGK